MAIAPLRPCLCIRMGGYPGSHSRPVRVSWGDLGHLPWYLPLSYHFGGDYVFPIDPPAPRCGDSDQGIYVGEWMVPRCYGIEGFEKGLLITEKTRKCLGVFEVFEKRRSFSKPPGSYFLYVGVPR